MKYTAESLAACNAAFIRTIRESCLSEDDYMREYFCEPAKLTALVLPEDYDACVLDPPYDVVPEELDPKLTYNSLYFGGDCGRSQNPTAICVLERGYDRQEKTCYLPRCVKEIRDQNFRVQHEMIRPTITNDFIHKGFIDQGTQGRALADSVSEETGSRIEPISFTTPLMAEMAERFRAFVQMGRIALPKDPVVRKSILSVRRKLSPLGKITYGGSSGYGHGDHFWSFATALHAAEGGTRTATKLLPQHDEAVLAQ